MMMIAHIPALASRFQRSRAARAAVDVHAIERDLLASLERGDARAAGVVDRLLEALDRLPAPAHGRSRYKDTLTS